MHWTFTFGLAQDDHIKKNTFSFPRPSSLGVNLWWISGGWEFFKDSPEKRTRNCRLGGVKNLPFFSRKFRSLQFFEMNEWHAKPPKMSNVVGFFLIPEKCFFATRERNHTLKNLKNLESDDVSNKTPPFFWGGPADSPWLFSWHPWN